MFGTRVLKRLPNSKTIEPDKARLDSLEVQNEIEQFEVWRKQRNFEMKVNYRTTQPKLEIPS